MFSEQRALEERQAAEKAASQVRYQACLSGANNNYEALWAAACKRLGEQSRKTMTTALRRTLGGNFVM
jgi:hypothetical protein